MCVHVCSARDNAASLRGISFKRATCLSSCSLADLMPKVKVEQVETVEGCTHEVQHKHTHIAQAVK